MEKKMCSVAIFDSESEKTNISLIKFLTKKITSRVNFLEATNQSEVISLIKENQIDLCFINLQFPGLGSKEMIRLLKEKNKQCWVVALNSVSLSPEVIKNEMGFDSCVEVGSSIFAPAIRSEVVDFIFYRN